MTFLESYERVHNEYIKRDDVRKVMVGNYVVYYVYEAKKRLITILRIVYGARNLEEIIALL